MKFISVKLLTQLLENSSVLNQWKHFKIWQLSRWVVHMETHCYHPVNHNNNSNWKKKAATPAKTKPLDSNFRSVSIGIHKYWC